MTVPNHPWYRGDSNPRTAEPSGGSSVVFVVDDDSNMATLLVQMLQTRQWPVETFSSAEAFLAEFDPDRPGCLVLDRRLPGMDGFALFSHMRGMAALLPVIFLSGYVDVASARYALLAGAFDYLEKPVDQRTLLTVVAAALERNRETREKRAIGDRLKGLTAREWDVLQLVVAGKPNKIIGSDLRIAQKTVEAHRAQVMSKTGAGSVADLVRIYSSFESGQLLNYRGSDMVSERRMARQA